MKRPKSSVGAVQAGTSRRVVPTDELPEQISTDEALLSLERCYTVERNHWESQISNGTRSYRSPRAYWGTADRTIEGKLVVDKGKKSVWRRLHEWFVQHKIDGREYIVYQFSQLMPASRTPEPDQLLSETRRKNWLRDEPRIDGELAVSLKMQQMIAETSRAMEIANGATSEKAWLIALSKSSIQLSALYRYCVAYCIGGPKFDKLCNYYADEAVLQFEQHRERYLRIWGRLLPPHFAEWSSQRYLEILEDRFPSKKGERK